MNFLPQYFKGYSQASIGTGALQTIKRMDLRRRVPRWQLRHVCLACLGMALLHQLGSCLVGANFSQKTSSSRVPAHQMSKVLQTVPTAPSFSFPPEPTVGKIEYKLRLTAEEGSERFEQLVTQLNWRMRECTSEEECAEFDDLSQYRDAIYRLGVSDDGQVPGLSDAELAESLSVLKAMAARIPATVTVISRKAGHGNRSAITALVRASQSSLFVSGGDEIRICTVGNVDSGKSTLLGLLTQGLQDDGRGRARSAVFRHRHEMETGRTSCIATTTLGFDQTGEVVNYKAILDKPTFYFFLKLDLMHTCIIASNFCHPKSNQLEVDGTGLFRSQEPHHNVGRIEAQARIAEKAAKLITFFDLCGHERPVMMPFWMSCWNSWFCGLLHFFLHNV